MRGLTDYAPRRLSPEQKMIWERLYKESEFLYGQEWAAHVATKVVDDMWTRSGHFRTPKLSRFPDPGNMIWLGYTVSLQYYDGKAHKPIVRNNFPRLPDCLWSPKLQAVMTYPRLTLPKATTSEHDLPELLKLYRKWHDGKSPKHGASFVKGLPLPVPTAAFPGVVIVYRSDKFEPDGEWVDYIHHFDTGSGNKPGPYIYKSDSAWMLRGGRLALTSGGLIH